MSACLSVQYTLAVMNIGSPSCGMNAASRSFVRLALTRGCRVLGIRFGFEGLVQDNVSVLFVSSVCSDFIDIFILTRKSSYIDVKTCVNWIIRPQVTLIIIQKNIIQMSTVASATFRYDEPRLKMSHEGACCHTTKI